MMHRSLIRKLAPALTAYLLLVSLGLPLQRIYCACVGAQWLSLTAAEHACHHAGKSEVNRHEQVKKTCRQLLHGSEEVPRAEDPHDCGDSELLLAQLDADFLAEQERAIIDLAPTGLQPVMANPKPRPPEATQAINIRGPTPPPLPHGRLLLVIQQTFLI